MIKNIFLSALFFSLTFYSYGQADNYMSWGQCRPNFGTNIPLTKFLKGETTDDLLSYDDRSYYLQYLSFAYFFDQHWGAELTIHPSTSQNISGRSERFIKSVTKEYEADYYVTPSSGGENSDDNIFTGGITRSYLGVIYRFEIKRFMIYPKVFGGITSFTADWGKAILKQKNSNTILQLDYNTEKRPQDNFTIASSVTCGYKLTENIAVNVDVLFSHYKGHSTFIKKITDLNSEKSTEQEYTYRNNIYTLSIGAGLIILFLR
jgi:hypothetical protein